MKNMVWNDSFRTIFKMSIALICFSFSTGLMGQVNLFELMERTDLTLEQVEKIANDHFNKVGTGQGSGFKQYQRWLYERKFHVDSKGYFIPASEEDKAYNKAIREMGPRNRTSLSWTELGPQAWTYTSGWNPGVGRITSVAIHPSDTTKIYVSSPGGGIWKSTNSGASWTPLIDFVNSSWMNVFHLCIDPGNQNTIYASLSSGGVLKSTNAGASWSATGSGPSGTKQVKVHPTNSSIVFAAASNGIWRSTNGGTSWTQVETATKEDIEFKPGNPNLMYASGSSGTSCVWRSTNNGVSWSAVTSGSGITNTGRTLLAICPADSAVVYAVQANGSLFGRLYRSNDSGLTFTTTVVGSATSGTQYFGYETTGTGTTGQATYDMTISVNPLNPNEVHIGGIILWKSLNGGTSFVAETAWSYPNSVGYNHADQHALEWINGTMYSGSDGGVYKSINTGGDWTDLSSGLGIRQFYRISCAKTDVNVITTGAQDNGSSFRRTNGTWVDWLGADGMDNAISPTNAAIAIGTSQYGAIYKTTNSGASRSNLSQPASGNWVTPIVMHPTTHDTVYGGWTGVWRSSNGGTNWTNISSGSITSTMDVLAVAPSNTRYIYATTGVTLYRTSNGGATWTSVTAPASITSIFVSKNNPAKIWLTCNSTSNRVFVSTDAGSTLTNISSGLPSLSARSVVVDEDASGTIYVGMNIGVYYRDSINNTWAEHATGLPLVAINEVEIQKSGNKLRVATYGRGVWESGLQNITVPCTAPGGLAASSIGTGSATVSWTAVSSAISYNVEYKESSASTWTTAASATTSTSVALSGLTTSTGYDWRVQTNCSSGSSSFANASFSTLSNCGDPSGLSVTAATTSSASLSWNGVSGASSYTLDYKLSSASTWTSTTTTSTSATLTSLSSGIYDWRVQATCSAGTSAYVSSVFQIYCASAGSSTSAGYIDLVSIGTISRTSGSDGGYYNGTASSTSVKPGTSYSITFSAGYTGSKKTVYFSVYVDYNLDGDFLDANELVGKNAIKSTGNGTLSFTVPSTASLGLSRIRISMSTTGYQGGCTSFSSGEVEDYSVNITTTPDPEPLALTPEKNIPVLYPNPASEMLNVHYQLGNSDLRTELRIVDMQGRAVFGTIESGSEGLNKAVLDIATVPAGTYILQIISTNGMQTKNFIITR